MKIAIPDTPSIGAAGRGGEGPDIIGVPRQAVTVAVLMLRATANDHRSVAARYKLSDKQGKTDAHADLIAAMLEAATSLDNAADDLIPNERKGAS